MPFCTLAAEQHRLLLISERVCLRLQVEKYIHFLTISTCIRPIVGSRGNRTSDNCHAALMGVVNYRAAIVSANFGGLCPTPLAVKLKLWLIMIKEANMGVNWSKEIDQTLAAAKEQSRPILLDFSAAPA